MEKGIQPLIYIFYVDAELMFNYVIPFAKFDYVVCVCAYIYIHTTQ